MYIHLGLKSGSELFASLSIWSILEKQSDIDKNLYLF